MAISLLQWNCRGIYRKLYEFKRFVEKLASPPDIIALQETHLVDKYVPKLPGFILIRKDRDVHGGGICFFIRNDMPFYEIQLTGLGAIEAQRINLPGLSVTNVYVPPNASVTSNTLQTLLDCCSTRSILLGDFNAHHPAWGSPTTNTIGRRLHHVIDTSGLVIVNTETATRFDSTGITAGTLIDLTLASPNIAHLMQAEVTDNLLGSDHFIILISTRWNVRKTSLHIPSWRLRSADWEKFSEICTTEITCQPSDAGQTSLDVFTDKLVEAATRSIPLTQPSSKTGVPWWNENCDKVVRLKRAAFLRMRRTFHIRDIILFRRRRAEARKTILETKKSYWQKFCNSLNRTSTLSKIWNVVKAMSGTRNSQYIRSVKSGNEVITNQGTIANRLALHFSSICSSDNYDSDFKNQRSRLEHDWSENDSSNRPTDPGMVVPFTMFELKMVLKNRRSTSPGCDRIVYAMLAHLPETCLCQLLSMFNELWESGTCPPTWRHAIVIPLLKQGKQPDDPTSYRPIALTSTLSKTMERMVANRLRWLLESNGVLHLSQSGFRNRRSTKDSIILLHDDIYKSLPNKRTTIALFLDIEKAFDMVWRAGLLHKLTKMGIGGAMLR